MSDPKDQWPLPHFNVGQHYHLHALGVIAVTVAQLERSIDSLYFFYPSEYKLPEDLTRLYYFNLNEEKRLSAIDMIFDAYEKDPEVKSLVVNLLEYFRWCRDARNQLLHAEPYPPGFGGDPDLLYLSKRLSKQSPVSGFMKLSKGYLRAIALRARRGIVQSATIHIYLRTRNQPLDQIEPSLRAYARGPLPKILHVPRPLRLTETP